MHSIPHKRSVYLLIFLIFTVNYTIAKNPIKSLPQITNNPILVSVDESRSNSINLEYELPEPQFKTITYQHRNGLTAKLLSFSNSNFHTVTGKPVIPSIPARIIIPDGHSIESISLIPSEIVHLNGRYLLPYSEIEQAYSTKEIKWAKADETVYSNSNVYPQKQYKCHDINSAFGVSIVTIDLFPVQYKPLSGMLSYFKNFTLTVKTSPSRFSGTGVKVRLDRFKERIGTEENPKALNSYIDGNIKGTYENRLCNSRESYDYLLITSQEIANSDAASDLIAKRESDGLLCKVSSVEDILTTYSGNTEKDKIRNFIKDAYNNWGIKFVTLGGDINIIDYYAPWTNMGYEQKQTPTDIPFQSLDGDSWNGDLECEVFIGRISAENVTEFSNQVHKILQYENEPADSPFLRTGLGLGQKLSSTLWGKMAIENIKSLFPSYWSYETLYEQDEDWSQEDLVAKLNTNKFSEIDHDGHAGFWTVMTVDTGDADNFENTKYPFAYSHGCVAGAFDKNCIAEHFTNEHMIGGYFSVVFNSREGIFTPGDIYDGPSINIHRSFWQGCWDLKQKYFSEFNEYSHRMNPNHKFTTRTTNLLGDAATPFRGWDYESSINPTISKQTNSLLNNVKVIGNSKLQFTLPKNTKVSLNVFSSNGRNIKNLLHNKKLTKGNHAVSIKSLNLASGVYYINFTAEETSLTNKIVINK